MIQASPRGDNNLKQLFDEFKFHLIYRNKQSQVTPGVSEEYKALIEQLKEETRAKRSKKRNMQEAINNQLKAKTHRPSTIQSRAWKHQPADYPSLQSIKDNLFAVQNQKECLNAQISNLQTSLAELKKNVAALRKSVESQGIKQQKFKHITYLTHSIQRNTASTKIINSRAFKKMVDIQDETLSSLKNFKTTLRKQNQELQSKYTQQKPVKKPQRHNFQSTTQITREIQGCVTKIDKNFMSRLEELIELLISKEEQFDIIKAEQTTKVRLKKVQTQYLKDDRIKMHEMIDRFEQKYDVKIQSLGNLILFIFKRLNQDNDYMQAKCINLYQIKQSLSQEYSKVYQKQGVISQHQSESQREKISNEEQLKQRISSNSKIFTKVIYSLHNLIAKFKYLFTMALTLGKEKKNFHDLLIKIETLYRPQQIFHHETNPDDLGHQTCININQVEQTCRLMNRQVRNQEYDWILELIFTDFRNSIVCRKKWLQQQFKKSVNSSSAEKVHNIQSKCDQVYQSKLKVYSLVLINCLKALVMNKYEKKMAACSTAKDSIFLRTQPKEVKIYNLDSIRQADTPENYKAEPTDTKFCSEESSDINQSFQFSSDPIKIVKTLEKLKNGQKTGFKPLKLEEQKVYVYDRKIVLPKFIL